MQRLIQGSRALGLRLTDEQQASFRLYYEELIAWNARFNLTAITEYDQVQIRHFLDSLSCLLADETRLALNHPGSRIIDVGTGAGFPGLPLKLVCPRMKLTLLESTGKKVVFLRHLVDQLGLTSIETIQARAEDLGRDPLHREQYDLALARAVAELPVVLEYTLPFCRVGGWVVAQKGEAGSAEAWASGQALSLLGGELLRVVPVELSGLPEDRSLVVIKKVGPTPNRYPRRPGIPSKRPLGTKKGGQFCG
jgi:16S rRNA (guanine527-N7)-methyltransferase